MTIWLSADHHINHHNIIRYCSRPFQNIQEMNETMISRWNAVVKPEDVVYHLGDIAFKNGLDVIKQLKGNIVLIRGNHDRGFTDTKLKEAGIKEVFYKPLEIVIEGKFCYLMHAPQEYRIGAFNFCGHVHEKWLFQFGFYNVGVDVHDFTPIEFNKAIDDLKVRL